MLYAAAYRQKKPLEIRNGVAYSDWNTISAVQ